MVYIVSFVVLFILSFWLMTRRIQNGFGYGRIPRFTNPAYQPQRLTEKPHSRLVRVTRLTTGDAKHEFGQIDVRELLTQMLAEFQPFAKELGVDVEMALPFKAMPIAMDPEKMRRAIDNLLINALSSSSNHSYDLVNSLHKKSEVNARDIMNF